MNSSPVLLQNGVAMRAPPGQKSGHSDSTPPGFAWGDLVAALVEEHGSLAQVAWRLVEQGGGAGDVASVERALRRLRTRGQRDGGAWGARLLRHFGVPRSVEARLRWMGLYHSPFNDLPLPVCLDLVRLWDRPPASESRARLWLQLARASCALRQRAFDEARVLLEAAAGQGRAADAAARVELALARGYVASRLSGAAEVDAALDEAEATLAEARATLEAPDRACFVARLADQRAYQLNHRGDAARALAIYAALPTEDVHPFASYRRDAGLAWGAFRAGRRDEARALAERACRHAGDGGYVRLRAMGLLLLARILDGAEAADALRRARAIATRLDDAELLARADRADLGMTRPGRS
jgi:tetratricopeptide (TPR) repeat protein